MIQVVKAGVQHLPQIREIYNHAIINSTAPFDEEPKSMADRIEWFQIHQDPKFPLIVAMEDGVVMGWGTISQFQMRSSYRFTGEISIYVKDGSRGKGIGTKILNELIELGKEQNYHALMSLIAAKNVKSLGLHQKFGFKEVGYYKEVAYKFGKWHDMFVMQKHL